MSLSLSSARLSLPYMAPVQAQKHVILNEALERLDWLTQLFVAGMINLPPDPVPEEGPA